MNNRAAERSRQRQRRLEMRRLEMRREETRREETRREESTKRRYRERFRYRQKERKQSIDARNKKTLSQLCEARDREIAKRQEEAAAAQEREKTKHYTTFRVKDTLKKGDEIPGSKYFRDFCTRCNVQMRVEQLLLTRDEKFCEECRPQLPTWQVAATKDDIHPWQENAIREWEDGGEW